MHRQGVDNHHGEQRWFLAAVDPVVDRAALHEHGGDRAAAAIEARLASIRSPFRSAAAFAVEEIIDPRDTRRLLCEFANLAAPMRKPGPRSFGYRP